MKAIVFAGNYKEYKHLMQECGIPVTHREWLWVADVYRPLSHQDVSDFRPFRGNVFQTMAMDETGSILPKDRYGKIQKRDLDARDVQDYTQNYRQSDYRNFGDGDINSSIYYLERDQDSIVSHATTMYSQYRSEQDEDITSLINNRARVYKGGSWKDGAYWMSPGARRFLDEQAASNDLGFRCAMTKVGSPAGM